MKKANVLEYRQRKKLMESVISNSIADRWENARHEWEVVDYRQDASGKGACICGRNDCIHLYKIQNVYNAKTLAFVGENCISKFDSESLNNSVNHVKRLRIMSKEWKADGYIKLKRFSPEDIDLFAKDNVIPANKYNNFNAENDIEFLKEFISKYRHKETREKLSQAQLKKAKTLMSLYIKPYLFQDKFAESS